MKTIESIVAELGGLTEVGKACSCRPSAVSYWVEQNFVPEWRREPMLALARDRGVGLTKEDFPERNSAASDAA